MSVLDKLKENAPPVELYHYTSQAGLIGVFDSDALWASKIHYLNDSTEFELALSLATEVLNEKLETMPNEQDKIKCLLDNIPIIQKVNVCVVSLSQKRDLLSQWRAYGGSAGGFSVGFKTNNLVTKSEEQGFFLVKCIYDPNEQRDIISSLIDECLADDFNLVPGYLDPDRPRTFVVLATGGDFTNKLASLAPIIKSKSFEEEAEWRVVSEKGLNSETLSFRSGLSTLTPYFEFKLGEKSDYIGSITIGPTPHPELAKDATHMLLGKHRIAQGTTIYETKIPFRNW